MQIIAFHFFKLPFLVLHTDVLHVFRLFQQGFLVAFATLNENPLVLQQFRGEVRAHKT